MQRGFSLMELMIVIAIMAILVGVAIPSYSQYTKRAHYTELVQATATYKVAVALCYQHRGNLNDCASGQDGIPAQQPETQDQLVQSIVVTTGGIITVTPNDQYGFHEEDQYILTPHVQQHRLTWKSSGKAVEKGYAK